MKSPSQVKARIMYLVRIEGGEYDIFNDEMAAQNNVESHEEQDVAASMEPVAVLSLSPAASEARIIEGARAMIATGHESKHHTEKWWRVFEKEYSGYWERMLAQSRAVSSVWGLLASAKEKGKKL